MKSNLLLIVLALIAFLVAGNGDYPSSLGGKNPVTEGEHLVTNVIDGDTIEVEINGQNSKIRLLGINTPESVDPRRPVECFAKEASEYLKNLIDGKYVSLELDPSQNNQDIYGRLLRYVYWNGVLINLKIIEGGYGYEYTYDNPYKMQSEFQKAQKQAEENRRGLWNPEGCKAEVTLMPTPLIINTECPIKGNISNGQMIYHLPECRDYNRTQINIDRGEKWFCNEFEATSSGWRKAGNCN